MTTPQSLIERLTEAPLRCAELERAQLISLATALDQKDAEIAKLVMAVGEHVTVRSEYCALLAQAAAALEHVRESLDSPSDETERLRLTRIDEALAAMNAEIARVRLQVRHREEIVDQYAALIARAAAALEQYGLHAWECPKNDAPENMECTCGFDTTLAALRAKAPTKLDTGQFMTPEEIAAEKTLIGSA